MLQENLIRESDLVGVEARHGEGSEIISLGKLSWEWRDEGRQQELRPCGEGSIFTFREFEEGHAGYSSESQSLEKYVVVTGRWAEARSNSNQTDVLQRYLWLQVIMGHCDGVVIVKSQVLC